MKKIIIFASDFKGIGLRNKLFAYAKSLDIAVEDIGVLEESPLDFVDLTKQLALKLDNSNTFGVLICNNGHGVTIAANKFNHIRAALCHTKEDTQKSRKKLNSNVLCLDCEDFSFENAQECLQAFVETPFENKKYGNSVEKLTSFATSHAQNGVNLIVRSVITHKNHILLSTTTDHNKEFSKNLYFLPGGHVDYKESAINALKRELLEELYLEAGKIRFIGALECSWDKKGSIYHEINLVYHVELPNLSLDKPPKSSEPFIKFVWCPTTDLSNYNILPQQLLPMLQEIVKKNNSALFYSQMIQTT